MDQMALPRVPFDHEKETKLFLAREASVTFGNKKINQSQLSTEISIFGFWRKKKRHFF
jgi:hypothetical protein